MNRRLTMIVEREVGARFLKAPTGSVLDGQLWIVEESRSRVRR